MALVKVTINGLVNKQFLVRGNSGIILSYKISSLVNSYDEFRKGLDLKGIHDNTYQYTTILSEDDLKLPQITMTGGHYYWDYKVNLNVKANQRAFKSLGVKL